MECFWKRPVERNGNCLARPRVRGNVNTKSWRFPRISLRDARGEGSQFRYGTRYSVLENRDNRGDGQDSLLVFFLKTGENNARTGRERRKGGVCRVYERWRNKESLDDVEGSARFRNGGGGGETSGRNSITKLQEPALIETHSSSTWEEIAGEVICRNGYLEFKKIL